MTMTSINVTTAAIREFSPITLAHEWSKTGRLTALVVCSSLGSVLNGFYIASFFIDRSLRRVGNVYLACVGLADMIITTIVIPTGAIVLLSGQWDIDPVCHVLHFLGITSTYSYNIFHMLVALENHFRICRSAQAYTVFINLNITIIAILVFTLCFTLAGMGVYLNLDYNYCTRTHYGVFEFRVGTAILFHLLPFIITVFCLFTAYAEIRRKARKKFLYKRSRQYDWDISSVTLNIITYTIFVVTWLPYLVVVYEFPGSIDANFYYSVWLGLSRPILNSSCYALFNRTFRQAFGHLFNYCCCKNTLGSSLNSRHRRTLEHRVKSGDIRVHVMQRALDGTPRYSSSTRETHEL